MSQAISHEKKQHKWSVFQYNFISKISTKQRISGYIHGIVLCYK